MMIPINFCSWALWVPLISTNIFYNKKNTVSKGSESVRPGPQFSLPPIILIMGFSFASHLEWNVVGWIMVTLDLLIPKQFLFSILDLQGVFF